LEYSESIKKDIKEKDKASFDTTYQMLQDKIKAIISSMQLN